MKTQRRRSRTSWQRLLGTGIALLVAGAVAPACGGVNDVNTKHSAAGAGNTGTAGPAGKTGTAGTAGLGAGGANTDGVCQPGERRCDGNTPQACDSGAWTSEAACDSTEACTGAGVCAAFRLVGAGIGTFGERPAEPVAGAKLILKEQTLSAAPRTCAAKLCITGDLR